MYTKKPVAISGTEFLMLIKKIKTVLTLIVPL